MGNSKFDVNSRYLYFGNYSHSGLQEVQGNPASGNDLYLEVQSTSSLANPLQAVYIDASTYKEIARYNLENCDTDYLIYIANVTIPNQQYFVQMIGTTVYQVMESHSRGLLIRS